MKDKKELQDRVEELQELVEECNQRIIELESILRLMALKVEKHIKDAIHE